MTELITLADLEGAARRIAPVAVRTPLLPFDHASELLGAEIWVKPEMLQRSGAFKFRGAYNFLAQLSRRRARARRGCAVVGQSRAGGRAGGAHVRRAGGGR